MGMYDTLYVKFPLPEKYKHMQNEDFQTKDFDCLLEGYDITEDGTLIKHERNASAGWLDWQLNSGDFEIIFYTFDPATITNQRSDGDLVEFVGVFKNGKMVEIKLLEDPQDFTELRKK